MPLYRVTAYPANACHPTPDSGNRVDEVMVHAKDAERARTLAVELLVKEERYSEIATFADPQMSEVVRIPSRKAEGIYAIYLHHCSDHM
jgi:hypothetical protein